MAEEQEDLQAAAEALKTAKEAITQRNYRLIQDNCNTIVDLSKKFLEYNSRTESELTIHMADLLIECGFMCNSLMQHKIAMSCYTHCACLVVNHHDTSATVSRLCTAVTSILHICLHVDDVMLALNIINKYSGYLIDLDNQESNNDVKACLGNMYLELGQDILKRGVREHKDTGKMYLEKGYHYLMDLKEAHHVQRYACLQSTLGQIKDPVDTNRIDHLMGALESWKQLEYPPEDAHMIVDTMKEFMMLQFASQNQTEFLEKFAEQTHQAMLKLNKKFHDFGLRTKVAEALTEIGDTASVHKHDSKAISFLKEALHLYHDQSPTSHEICNLLNHIGILQYNNDQYEDSVTTYCELLDILETNSEISNPRIRAKCYVLLGFSYSNLQDFPNVLTFYSRTIELKSYVDPENLEAIEIHIGNLYFIQAVLSMEENDLRTSQDFYTSAEKAFTTASMRYSWRSSPYINLGYYLLYRGKYQLSCDTLQHAYLNAVSDHDVIEIDKIQFPVLLEDFRTELEKQSDDHMLVPATVMALYLKSLAQLKMEQREDAKSTAKQLQQEINDANNYNFSDFTCSCTPNDLKAISYSLLAYLYRDMDNLEKAIETLQLALKVAPDHISAKINISSLQAAFIKETI